MTCQLCNDSTGNTQPLSQYKPELKISRPHRTQPAMMSHEHNSIGGIGTCEDQAMAPHLLPAAHPNRFLCRHVKTSSICSDLQLLPSSVHRTIIPERSGSMKTTAASGTANGQLAPVPLQPVLLQSELNAGPPPISSDCALLPAIHMGPYGLTQDWEENVLRSANRRPNQ